MILRVLAILAALVPAATLAGCASEPAEPAAAAETPVVITDPGDFSYLQNESLADAPHLHDYWGGAETLVVMDAREGRATMIIDPYAAFSFQPPDGKVVPQGTERVEVTFSWEDEKPALYEDPELWVQSAADNDPFLVGPIEKGTPVEVPSTNEMNDLPHQGLSAWTFQLRVYPLADNGEYVAFDAEVSLLVRAHRGLDIPLYPGHPDQWDNATEIPLFHAEREFSLVVGGGEGGQACLTGCIAIHKPDDGALVPTTAAAVEVTITQGPEMTTRIGLRYHGADTRAFQEVEPTATEGNTRVYVIPVTSGLGDGPYAKQSLWEFLPYIDEPVKDGAHFGSFTMTARALRDAP